MLMYTKGYREGQQSICNKLCQAKDTCSRYAYIAARQIEQSMALAGHYTIDAEVLAFLAEATSEGRSRLPYGAVEAYLHCKLCHCG